MRTYSTHFFDRSNVQVHITFKVFILHKFADKITCTSMWSSMYAGGANLEAKLLSFT